MPTAFDDSTPRAFFACMMIRRIAAQKGSARASWNAASCPATGSYPSPRHIDDTTRFEAEETRVASTYPPQKLKVQGHSRHGGAYAEIPGRMCFPPKPVDR